MSDDDKALIVVAIRADHREVHRRLQTILAVAGTYDKPPDTEACVFAREVSELVATDLDHLAYFMGWEGVRRLNVGDVVAESSGTA